MFAGQNGLDDGWDEAQSTLLVQEDHKRGSPCRHAHGKGYAREAAAAALRWADEKLRFDESVAIINAANAPSIKLAEAVGYADRAEALYHGEPILLFRRRRASA